MMTRKRVHKVLRQNRSALFTRREILRFASAAAFLPMSGSLLTAQERKRVTPPPLLAQPLHGVLIPAPAPTREDLAIVNEITNEMKHAFATAASRLPESFPRGSYAAICQNYLRRQTPERQRQISEKATAILAGASIERRKMFGRYVDTAPEYHKLEHRPRDPIIVPMKSVIVRQSATSKALLKLAEAAKQKPHMIIPDGVKIPTYTKLSFILHNIECIEDTDENDSDEILFGGMGFYPSGKQIKVSEWKVHDDFDKGEKISLSMQKFIVFDLTAAGEPPWPRSYAITLIMGEEDTGGFKEFLEELWDKAGAYVEAAVLSAATGIATGVALEAGASAAAAGAIGGAIGSLVAAAVAALFVWLIEVFDNPDDIIGQGTWTLNLLRNDKYYFDSLPIQGPVAPPGVMQFINKSEDCHYNVTMHWEVSDLVG